MEIYRDNISSTPPRQRGHGDVDARRREALTPRDTNRRQREHDEEDGNSKSEGDAKASLIARAEAVRDKGTTSLRTSKLVKPKFVSPRKKNGVAVAGPGSLGGAVAEEQASSLQEGQSTSKCIQFDIATKTGTAKEAATKRRTSILRSTDDQGSQNGSRLRSSLSKPAARVSAGTNEGGIRKAVSISTTIKINGSDRTDPLKVPTTESQMDGKDGPQKKNNDIPVVGAEIPLAHKPRSDGGDHALKSASSGLREFIKERRSLIERNDTESLSNLPSGQCTARGGGILLDLSNAFSPASTSSPPVGKHSFARREGKDEKQEALSESRKPLPVVSLGNFQESLWLDFGDESRNIVGKMRSLSFLLEAPQFSSPSGYHRVEFERVPFKKGFNLIVEDDMTQQRKDNSAPRLSTTTCNATPSSRHIVIGAADEDYDDDSQAHTSATVLCIKNGDRKRLRLTWTPTEVGGVRETVHLKLARGRIRITAHGKARGLVKRKKRATPGKVLSTQPQPQTTPFSGALPATDNNKAKVLSLATPGHTTEKRSKRVSHGGLATPPPNFATPKTVYAKSSSAGSVTSASKTRAQITYDSEWADKQCDAFAKWLNYTFHPTEDVAHERSLEDMQEGIDGAALDRVGLRTLLLHRRRAQGRQKAIELYQTDEMKAMRRAIEAEVSGGRLAIRSDRDVFADVGLRKQMMSLLLSYSTPWLRLGLEIVFGETISSDITHRPTQNKTKGAPGNAEITVTRPKTLLRHFIVNRVLSDPVLAKKYTGGRCKVLSGRFERQYKAELRRHSLSRILLLVTFLDRAKRENILDKVPCLFTRNGIVKSSRDVLVAICRDYLSMESNIIKHLSKIGVTVSYKQDPIDEFDYTIQNLAVDLRDGVRLSRMVETLTQDSESSLLKKLRLPAVSRLQKLHNVGIALAALNDAGVPNLNDISTHHIVDGHRPQVLKLLWSTIAHFKLASLLNLDLLREEIGNVLRANKSRRMSLSFDRDTRPVVSTSATLFDGIEGEIGILLLQWCQAVCSCFGFHVANFSSSFADGKALCLLLHYYHPGILRKAEILPTTRDLPKSALSQNSDGRYEEALKNERLNSTLANKRMLELGGIPGMLPVTDSQNFPEEKSTILCVAYLCSRLMESSKEILATIAIQNCYRRYQNRILRLRKEIAALVIFKFWTEKKDAYFEAQRLKYGAAVRVLEAFLYSNKLKFELIRAKRMDEECRRASACLIQSSFRRKRASIRFKDKLSQFWAAKTIQTPFRAHLQQSRYAMMKHSAVTIQSIYRGHLVRCKVKSLHANATIIQSLWRGFSAMFQFQCNLMDITTAQSCARHRAAILEAKKRRMAVLIIQSSTRRFLACRRRTVLREAKIQFDRLVVATIACQSWARQRMVVKRYRSQLARFRAAVTIQSIFRSYLSRRATELMHSSARTIQTAWRRFRAELQYEYALMDIICAQSCARRLIALEKAKKTRASVLQIQCAARMWLSLRKLRALREDRDYAQRLHAATVLCQSFVRRRVLVENFRAQLACSQAAVKIQACHRAQRQRSLYCKIVDATTVIQRYYRGFRSRRQTELQCFCATVIQTAWRGFWAELKYECALMDIIYAQSCARRFLATVEAAKRQSSSLKLQCAVRSWLSVRRLSALQAKKFDDDRSVAAAIVCQSFARKRMAMIRVKAERDCFRAALTVQTFIRAQRKQSRYVSMKQSAILIQSLFRGHRIKHQIKSFSEHATLVQALFRAHLQQLHYCRIKEAAVLVQSSYRGYQRRHELMVSRASSVAIQAVWRGYSAELRYHYALMSVICIQSCVRRLLASRDTSLCLSALETVQCAARKWMARQRLAALRQTREEEETAYLCFISCVKIQTVVRGMQSRILCHKHKAARQIQKTWRGYVEHVDFMMSILSAIVIQARARQVFCRERYKMARRGFVALQAVSRGANFRREAQLNAAMAIRLQTWYRSAHAASLFRMHQHASVLIQSAARGMLTRNGIHLQQFAASEIQRIWRGFHANVDYIMILLAAIKMQSVFRQAAAQRLVSALKGYTLLEKVDMRYRNYMAKKIQHAFRSMIRHKAMQQSAVTIQRVGRGFLAKRHASKLKKVILFVQSTCRARSVRRMRSRKARAAAVRVAKANQKAESNPQMKLGVRTSGALIVLQTSKRLSEVIRAMKTLEVSTRLSERCCIAFASAKAPRILYALVRTCNRSLPHVELLSYVTQTLVNVAKYTDLLASVATDDSIEVLMDLTQMFRDKEDIFCLSMFLLERIVFSGDAFMMQCRTEENIKRLEGIHALCKRRQKLTKGQRKRTVKDLGMGSAHHDMRHGIRLLEHILRALRK